MQNNLENIALTFDSVSSFTRIHPMTTYNWIVPSGSISVFAGTQRPVGWLFCNGQSVSRSEYATLFSVIGTTYGSDDSETFKVPNLQGRIPVGKDNSYFSSLSQTGGETGHILTVDEMPIHSHTHTMGVTGAHSHSITDPGHTHSYVNNVNNQNTDNAFASETAADNADLAQTTGSSTTGISINSNGDHNHSLTIDNTGGGLIHNNLQPYIVMNYIIKY